MPVRTEPQQGGIHVITLDRPDRRNAIDGPMAEQLADAVAAFERDDSACVAILTGAGDTFCTGNDLRAIAAGDFPAPTLDGPPPMRVTRTPCAKPVIAAIEGYCFGGGFELALWCDLRVASTIVEFGLLNFAHGLPSLDAATVRLPRLIGHSRAMAMILTAERIPAAKAEEYGLLTRLVEPGQATAAARELAATVASLPSPALRTARRSAIEQWSLSEAEATINETRLALTAFQ